VIKQTPGKVPLKITGAFILALAGCTQDAKTSGSPSTTAASASPTQSIRTAQGKPDACALVTKADVEAALGWSMEGPEARPMAGGTQCSYKSAVKQISVEAMDNNVGYEPDYFAIDKKGAGMTEKILGKSQPITGIGDDAYWDGSLHVLRKHVYFIVRASGLGTQSMETAKTLAQKALELIGS